MDIINTNTVLIKARCFCTVSLGVIYGFTLIVINSATCMLIHKKVLKRAKIKINNSMFNVFLFVLNIQFYF